MSSFCRELREVERGRSICPASQRRLPPESCDGGMTVLKALGHWGSDTVERYIGNALVDTLQKVAAAIKGNEFSGGARLPS
eukprot:4663125-Amphidinium_carterae.1